MPAFHPVISSAASSPNLTWSLIVLQKRRTPGIGPRGCGLGIDGSIATAQPASGRLFVLLVVVDLGELRVDNVLVLAAGALTAGCAVGTTRAARRRGLFLRLLVHRLAELHRSLRQRVGLGRDRLGVGALQGLLEVGQRVLDRAPVAFADLGAVLGQRLLGGVHQRLGVVLGLDLGLALLVFLGVRFSVLDHALDVGLGQAARSLDADL